MNSKDILPNGQPERDVVGVNHQNDSRNKPVVRVKEVPERDRKRLLMHFLALSDNDRLLRFGSVLPDEVLTRYVQRLDFSRDTVLGVYDEGLRLVGVGHLAFIPRASLPKIAHATRKERIAEFGVSVSESSRGMGIGSRLFQRAAMHCRNAEVDTLHMHCLASNQAMIYIARKAGMQIQRDHSEADAYLKLAPANPASVLQEAVEEQVASLDYTLKVNTHAALKLMESMPVFKA